MSSLGFNDQEHARVDHAYTACVELVDDHLLSYDPQRDDMPVEMARAIGLGDDFAPETVRYTLTDTLPKGFLPRPYSSVLESTSIIALQKVEVPEIGRRPAGVVRKIELLDPFRQMGHATLLMLSVEDQDITHPDIPGAIAEGEAIHSAHRRPFYDPDLADNTLDLVSRIRKLSIAGRLAHISFDDVQAMYKLQHQLDS